mmetsp:Transcript_76176/g.176709  ORF Transcript_76176/g.176709 Transcript_76176/m.176709 type:complete len:204 (-) Transcript_76176:767-1378(-)
MPRSVVTIVFARSTQSGGPAMNSCASPACKPACGPCRMSKYVLVKSFNAFITCQWSPRRRLTLLASTGKNAEEWPMPVWSPATTRMTRSSQASTCSRVPKICTWMFPSLSLRPLSAIMWHLITPLVWRIFSMVWPCKPSKWPFFLAGTSMIRSSFGPSASNTLSSPLLSTAAGKLPALPISAEMSGCNASTRFPGAPAARLLS